jgi:uncharacterized membrane protein HdeD (DUF308 family)
MIKELTRHWWAVGLRGLAAVVLGILALAWPGLTLWALVVLFGVWAIVEGIIGLVSAFRPDVWHRGVAVFEGLVSIGLGVLALVWPGVTAVALLYLIAAWAIATGMLKLIDAVRLRTIIENEWLLGLSGLASVAFGVMVTFRPGAGALAVVWLIGAYALFFGALLIALAFRLRALGHEVKRPEHGGVGSAAGSAF